MNAQKESLKNIPESLKKTSIHKLPVCDENESRRIRKKRRVRKNVFDGRREFIGHLWKSSMIDRKEPQVDDC